MSLQANVLYVEDDARSRKIMLMLLKMRMGLQHVTVFEDSHDFEARVKALEPKPDLILLDIHVPPYDGFQMLHMLRNMPEFAHTTVVALTASVMAEEIQQLQTAGFDSCIAKPVDMDTFPEMIKRIAAGESIWAIIA